MTATNSDGTYTHEFLLWDAKLAARVTGRDLIDAARHLRRALGVPKEATPAFVFGLADIKAETSPIVAALRKAHLDASASLLRGDGRPRRPRPDRGHQAPAAQLTLSPSPETLAAPQRHYSATPLRNPCSSSEGVPIITTDTTDPMAARVESVLHTITTSWAWQVHIDPRRHRIGLTVERDASVTVAIPPGISPQEAIEAVAGKVDWIAHRVRLARKTAPDYPVKELVSGEGFPWFGRSHRLRLIDDDDEPTVRLEPGPAGWLRLQRSHAHDGQALIDWYSTGLQEHLAETTPRWHSRLGIRNPVTYRAADLGENQSVVQLSSTPTITLHWATAQLQLTHVSYLLARELCHVAAGRRLGKREHQTRLNSCMPGWTDHLRLMTQDWRRTWIGTVSLPRPQTRPDTALYCRICQGEIAPGAERLITAVEPRTNPWCCPTCWKRT
ncbi:YgjP-like metallopeptidase domain-containing protein [Nonomuraea sp. NPDC046802]|uniref:YgjP-like metallopeptidase domain-containing protein n=1 Tax=Nonomuraea sp. NPDC046802 TaxID=3154919 RepID=UPI0034032508